MVGETRTHERQRGVAPARGRHDPKERGRQQELEEGDLRGERDRRLARDELGGGPEDGERPKLRRLREPI